MDIISYVHKSGELLFQILGLVEVWTRLDSFFYTFLNIFGSGET